MLDYNPFDKELAEIKRKDLDLLISKKVAEGWYVEFKSDFTSPKGVGHSIASFANTDGGWYIIGVEANKDTNEVEEIVGFELGKSKKPKDTISNIVRDHITPKPFFESKLVKVGEGRGVLVIRIEQGSEPPYITNDGRIYQRVGEQSSPLEIRDRYLLEKLFDRSRESKQRIENFCRNTLVMSKGQKEQNSCFLEIYLFFKPFNSFTFKDFLQKSFFLNMQKVLNEDVTIFGKDAKSIKGGISFNNIYTSFDSYILRHFQRPSAGIDVTLTIEIFRNGNAKFLIPFEKLQPGIEGQSHVYEYSEYIGEFEDLIHYHIPNPQNLLNVVDAYKVFFIVSILFGKYIEFLKGHKIPGSLYLRMRVSNCWRVLLYFDDEAYIHYIKEYGLPICQKESIEVPQFSEGHAIPIEVKSNSILNPIVFLFQFLGYPLSHQIDSFHDIAQYMFGLSKSSKRSKSGDSAE